MGVQEGLTVKKNFSTPLFFMKALEGFGNSAIWK
jgi:hypothetical protein